MDVPAGTETRPLGTIEHDVRRLACLADIHGNTAALDAVLGCEQFAAADAVAVLGCATAGPDPRGTLERLARIEAPTHYLSGNGERAILEMAAGTRALERALDAWLVQAHGAAELATLSSWPGALSCTMRGGERLRLCHGSPRSDIEVITPESPAERLREALAGVEETTVVHGHTHIQYERRIADRHLVGPGSVGLPYTDGPFGAYWAVISETVELIVTPYEIGAAEELVARTGYPSVRFLDQLRSPVSPAQIIADAEPQVFVD